MDHRFLAHIWQPSINVLWDAHSRLLAAYENRISPNSPGLASINYFHRSLVNQYGRTGWSRIHLRSLIVNTDVQHNLRQHATPFTIIIHPRRYHNKAGHAGPLSCCNRMLKPKFGLLALSACNICGCYIYYHWIDSFFFFFFNLLFLVENINMKTV
jgi:hypothetical protein